MGVCSFNKPSSIIVSRKNNDLIDTCRNSLIEAIKKIHKLNLSCISGIEDCLLIHQKNKAVIIKAKQIHLRKISDKLKDFVKKIDFAVESDTSVEVNEKLAEEINFCWQNRFDWALADDIAKIVKLSITDEYIVFLQEKLQIKELNLEEQIENELGC